MIPLTAALTRDEVARFLELSPDVVDALIRGGHLLCHLRDGQERVPLEQIERFLRDELVRLYRTEAQLTPVLEVPSKAVEAVSTVAAEPVQVELAPPPAVDTPRPEEPESRANPRYIPRRQIDGIFKDVKFSIVQMSDTGLRIRHKDQLVPGEEAKVSFALLRPPQSFVMRARVVWTSIAKYESAEETFCISGLRVTEHGDRLAQAIERLRTLHELEPERRATPRVGAATADGIEGVSDDEVALVLNVAQKFAADPQEASRWYSRARFALADAKVRRAAPRRQRDRDEVLGIWEYLERQIEIPKVASVVSWMRASRGRAAVM